MEREGADDLLLIFDANAIMSLEGALRREYGRDVPLPEILQMLEQGNFSMTLIICMLYAAARRNHKLSVEEAGDVLSEEGFDRTMEAVTSAMKNAYGQENGGEPGEVKPPNRRGRRAAKSGAGKAD